MNTPGPTSSGYLGAIFRVALFAAGFSLAGYVLYQYLGRPHATEGFYAVLFPLSSLLSLAGMVFAVRPRSACSCSLGLRAGLGALSMVWIATGMMCMPMLLAWIGESPGKGIFALFHMIAQHVFLSLSVMAFVFFPRRVSQWLTGALVPAPEERSDEAAANVP